MSKDFKREDSHKRKKASSSWRKPKGRHSRARLQKKGAGVKMPKAGYRKEKENRGLHPSGYEEVLVHNTADLEQLEENQAARIASKVGGKKRNAIIEKADEEDIHVFNRGEE